MDGDNHPQRSNFDSPPREKYEYHQLDYLLQIPGAMPATDQKRHLKNSIQTHYQNHSNSAKGQSKSSSWFCPTNQYKHADHADQSLAPLQKNNVVSYCFFT